MTPEPLNYIARPTYEERLRAYRNTPDIKVLTGVRRCGKSSLLNMTARTIEQDGIPASNIYCKRMDSLETPLDPTAEWLESEIVNALSVANSDHPFYVFLDEIQDVRGWERVVRRLHTAPNIDVYITGSNAHVLSSDLSTHIGGRYVEIRVSPLSFAEYLAFAEAKGTPCGSASELFTSYVRYGGMPAQFELPDLNPDYIRPMLETVYETIILNDVAMHTRIADMNLLAKLVRYTFSTSGSLFSTRNIVNALASSGGKTSSETVESYLAALVNAYIVNACEQAGLAGKAVLRPQRKFFPCDTGLRNLMTGFSPRDIGAQLECVAYNELRRRGYDVRIGALPKSEVDFVATRASERLYIQVTDSMLDEKTYLRETSAFTGIADSFPKIILTTDTLRAGITEQGVRIVPITNWLLNPA